MYNLESVFQHGMWDLCQESWGKISETLKRCCIDICCLQEVRWKGQGAKMIGNGFKFLWSGVCKAENGVGVIVANWLIVKVAGVERFNDRVMKVNIVIGEVVWEVSYCYCPQASRSVNEKEEFYELIDKAVTSDKVLMGGDFNGHVGSDVGSFGEVYRGFRIEQINDGRIRFLDWTVAKGLRLMNTCFQKRKSWLITFRSGQTETMIDYILVNNKYRRVGVVVKIEDMIIQRYLQWYGHVMRGDINSQIREVMELEMTGKRKKG